MLLIFKKTKQNILSLIKWVSNKTRNVVKTLTFAWWWFSSYHSNKLWAELRTGMGIQFIEVDPSCLSSCNPFHQCWHALLTNDVKLKSVEVFHIEVVCKPSFFFSASILCSLFLLILKTCADLTKIIWTQLPGLCIKAIGAPLEPVSSYNRAMTQRTALVERHPQFMACKVHSDNLPC